MSELVIARDDNWEGLYVDGELQYQNHSDRGWPDKVVDILNEYDVDSAERIWAKMQTDDEGRLLATSYPSTLDEIYDSDDYAVQ